MIICNLRFTVLNDTMWGRSLALEQLTETRVAIRWRWCTPLISALGGGGGGGSPGAPPKKKWCEGGGGFPFFFPPGGGGGGGGGQKNLWKFEAIQSYIVRLCIEKRN